MTTNADKWLADKIYSKIDLADCDCTASSVLDLCSKKPKNSEQQPPSQENRRYAPDPITYHFETPDETRYVICWYVYNKKDDTA